jgi:hypothetical protein
MHDTKLRVQAGSEGLGLVGGHDWVTWRERLQPPMLDDLASQIDPKVLPVTAPRHWATPVERTKLGVILTNILF